MSFSYLLLFYLKSSPNLIGISNYVYYYCGGRNYTLHQKKLNVFIDYFCGWRVVLPCKTIDDFSAWAFSPTYSDLSITSALFATTPPPYFATDFFYSRDMLFRDYIFFCMKSSHRSKKELTNKIRKIYLSHIGVTINNPNIYRCNVWRHWKKLKIT